jgi:hypothetical protein
MTNQQEPLTFKHYIQNQINDFLDKVFETSVIGGNYRRWIFIFIGGFLWALGAVILTPSTPEDTFFSYPFRALFAPQIFRHIIILMAAFYYALRLSAQYLADVFELSDVSIATSYILQASLADLYDVITISKGKVSNRESTLIKIGGPGIVKVDLDSVALFEKSDGSPTVVGPQHGQVALDRFERLRRVVSLQGHVSETKVNARTRDGIPISAEGIKIRYHINRDNQESTLIAPYPFVSHAVTRIIYGETVSKHIHPNSTEEISVLSHVNKNPEYMEIKSNTIENKLQKFISGHSLSEFLARIGEREIQDLNDQTQTIEMEAKKLTGENYIATKETEIPDAGIFFTRDQITKSLYEVNNYMERINTGIQMDWIDIGNWKFPPNARGIDKQHLEAWKITLKNLENRSESNQQKLESNSNTLAIRVVLAEVIDALDKVSAQYTSTVNPDQVDAGLQVFRKKLYNTQNIYRKQGLPTPIRLSNVLQHLDTLLNETHIHTNS